MQFHQRARSCEARAAWIGAVVVSLACTTRTVGQPIDATEAKPSSAVEIVHAEPARSVDLAAAAPSLMEEIAALDDDARWAWAVERMPQLGRHQPTRWPAQKQAFLAWLARDDIGRLYLAEADGCLRVDGQVDGEVFRGRARQRTTYRGKTKYTSWMTIQVSASGIIESGPSSTTFRRTANRDWESIGGSAMGWAEVLVRNHVSQFDDEGVYYGDYEYTLKIECAAMDTVEQTCIDGGSRRCEQCARLFARRKVRGPGRAFGHAYTGSTTVSSHPVDCATPCPPDPLTPLVEPLQTIVAGRVFSETDSHRVGVFRTQRACQRDHKRAR
jgi:hypothetical protein